MEYEHREFVGGKQEPPLLPLLEDGVTESLCVQQAPSFVPGLTCRQWWDTSDVGWCQKLEGSYPEIREEFVKVTSDADSLTERGNNVWAGALTEDASSYGSGWRTLVLLDRGRWDPTNCALFPRTARAVLESGIPATEVFFASMSAGSDIKVHSDFTNFVLTSHLAMIVPGNGGDKCRLTVGDETRQWIEGTVSLFDTSILHSAVNESDGTRYILMFRLWHPDLTDVEREALQTIYDCLEVPDLMSDDAGARFMAERRVEMARTFPQRLQEQDDYNSNKGGSGEISGGARKGKVKKGKGKRERGKGKGFGA